LIVQKGIPSVILKSQGLPVSMKEAEGGAGKAVEKWLTKLGLKK